MKTILACRHCGMPWPGDDALTLDDLRKGEKVEMPICIKSPPRDRWFVDSGINGHMFEPVTPSNGRETP